MEKEREIPPLYLQVVCLLSPTENITQEDDGNITVQTRWTGFDSDSVTFQLNQPFKEETADGRTVTTTSLWLGNRLVKQQVGTGTNLTTIETRQFLEDGQKMMLTLIVPSKPNIKAIRNYTRTE